MQSKHMCRFLATLSAIAAFGTGAALTLAPSTARAKTGDPIVMSGGKVDCPACQLLETYDKDGLSFRDVIAAFEDGNQIVITAQVVVTGTGGKPRIGSVVFSASMDSDGAGFMDYSDEGCTPWSMSRQAGDQACAAVSRALRDAAPPAPSTTLPAAPTEGIIMRDGGICDPIRHMGC